MGIRNNQLQVRIWRLGWIWMRWERGRYWLGLGMLIVRRLWIVGLPKQCGIPGYCNLIVIYSPLEALWSLDLRGCMGISGISSFYFQLQLHQFASDRFGPNIPTTRLSLPNISFLIVDGALHGGFPANAVSVLGTNSPVSQDRSYEIPSI
jgi:hypothetical protein